MKNLIIIFSLLALVGCSPALEGGVRTTLERAGLQQEIEYQSFENLEALAAHIVKEFPGEIELVDNSLLLRIPPGSLQSRAPALREALAQVGHHAGREVVSGKRVSLDVRAVDRPWIEQQIRAGIDVGRAGRPGQIEVKESRATMPTVQLFVAAPAPEKPAAVERKEAAKIQPARVKTSREPATRTAEKPAAAAAVPDQELSFLTTATGGSAQKTKAPVFPPYTSVFFSFDVPQHALAARRQALAETLQKAGKYAAANKVHSIVIFGDDGPPQRQTPFAWMREEMKKGFGEQKSQVPLFTLQDTTKGSTVLTGTPVTVHFLKLNKNVPGVQ